MSKSIGIDLGTTFSLASFINPVGRPQLIPNAEASVLTPSAVWAKDGMVLVGDAATNMALAEPDYLATQMKRRMGDDDFRFHGMTATDAATHILAKIKRDAEAFFEGEAVTSAAITVPAYFTDLPLKATKQAGERAGLEVLALPKEPTAAALFYSTSQMRDGDRIVVWDVGGGTTDATVLGYSKSGGEEEFTVLASDGSRELGGEDWTRELFDMASAAFEQEMGVAPSSAAGVDQALLAACESAKRALSMQESGKIVVSWGGRLFSFPVTRSEFEAATAHLTMAAVDKAEGAVNKAGLGWGSISRILLVGGATRMGALGRALHGRSGLKPEMWGVPDQLVGLGAALYTGRRVVAGGVQLVVNGSAAGSGIVLRLRESTTHGLGTLVVDRASGRTRLVSSVIIKPGTPVPAKGVRAGYLTRPHQTEIDIPVVQTDSDGLEPKACVLNKTYRFLGVPDRGTESAIRVSFQYDQDSMIDVAAVDETSGKALGKTLVNSELPESGGAEVLFVLDTSGSMAGAPLAALKEQVHKVCAELSGKSCLAGVVEFGNRVRVVCGMTDDFPAIKRAVSALDAGNGTPMGEGLAAACGLLAGGGDGRVLILVSDGCPDSEEAAIREANRVKQLGAALYTISIGSAGGEFLHRIGDSYVAIQSAGDLAAAIGKLLWKA
jgi:molecular chaperone DnaK